MTLKSRLVAAASVFTLIASGCATTQQGQPTQGGGSSTVEELPNEGGGQQAGAQAAPAGPQLNDVGSAEEGFTAKMPGAPQVARNKITVPAGDVNIATWNSNVDGVIYALTTADYPEKIVAGRTAETMLNKEGRDSLVGQLKGTLKSEENITINDKYPGKAFVVSSDNGEVKARTYLVGTRLYTMVVLFNPSIGAPAADGFLTSLSLINQPPMVSKGSAPAAPAPGTTDGTTGTGTPEGAAPGGTTPPPPNPGTN